MELAADVLGEEWEGYVSESVVRATEKVFP